MTVTKEDPPDRGDPYRYDPGIEVPNEVLQLWDSVRQGLEDNQTVVWKKAVESLDLACRYLEVAEPARLFVEKYMAQIVSILVEQIPGKIGNMEKGCVEDSLAFAVQIIAKDLEIQLHRNGDSKILDTLAVILTKKKAYYRGHKGGWGGSHTSGRPDVRLRLLDEFRALKGLKMLADYMQTRLKSPNFPSLENLYHILSAILESLSVRNVTPQSRMDLEPDAILVCQATIAYITSCTDDLKKLPQDQLTSVRYTLQRIYEQVSDDNWKELYAFYEFWRALTLKFITSKSLPLKLFGWEQTNDLIACAQDSRPPPRSYIVSGAGRSFCNGEYKYAGPVTPDGYTKLGTDVSYVRVIPDGEPDGGGKTLTLFRCTMRSQQKWWFLSEADKEQPGTDRDIDYYQHKSQHHEERQPPPTNWVTCSKSGVNPPPTLKEEGIMVPPGEEYNTLEHQLAQWAIENRIVEDVLGDSLHREIVARSTPLIKFLASMCERDKPVPNATRPPNEFCLKSSHLLLAWKTCTSKADAAVSDEVYRLLVSILPTLPDSLAITLLSAVQNSLLSKDLKRDYLSEVAEFCSVLSTSLAVGGRTNHSEDASTLADDVRTEVLKLLWAVLTHPDASSLKTYDNLKRYVNCELRVEPMGSVHRENFLDTCRTALEANSMQFQGPVEEALALRMVKLTHFILEACPRDQAASLVSANGGALAKLIFDELTAYITRRNAELSVAPMQKRTGNGDAKYSGRAALSERLKILRYAYGVSNQVFLSLEKLKGLWQLCRFPSDQEDLMVFIASASTSTQLINAVADPPVLQPQQNQVLPSQPREMVDSAFETEVQAAVFLDIFCSSTVKWGELGEGAYPSFQQMYKTMEKIPVSVPGASARALDALWRICLEAGNDGVASQAMKDLLGVYVSMAAKKRQGAWALGQPGSNKQPASGQDDFGDRVFSILSGVRDGLKVGDITSERKAERMLRILNEAIGQDGSSTAAIAKSTVVSLLALPPNASLADVVALLPHGMRGQSSYRRVSAMVRRTHNTPSTPNPSSHGPVPPAGRDDVPGSAFQRRPGSDRFPIEVHPLETLLSLKVKIARLSQCPITSVRLISIQGRLTGTGTRPPAGDASQMSLSVLPDGAVMDELGVIDGCEMVFLLNEIKAQPNNVPPGIKPRMGFSMSDVFADRENDFAGRLFDMILEILSFLPWRKSLDTKSGPDGSHVDTHKLVWDLLFAMPSNEIVVDSVRSSVLQQENSADDPDAMVVDSVQDRWESLLDKRSFHRSVYVMQVIDSLLQPAPEVLSSITSAMAQNDERNLTGTLIVEAETFRRSFITTGGFDAVARFFATTGDTKTHQQSESRMGNAVALRILKCCLFGHDVSAPSLEERARQGEDEAGAHLLQKLPDTEGLMRSLTSMVVNDEGISSTTIADVQRFLRLLFQSPHTTEIFVSLPDKLAEKFLITLLLWDAGPEITRTTSSVGSSESIRKDMHDLILQFPLLGRRALPWLIHAMDEVDVTSDSTSEYFDVLRNIVAVPGEGTSNADASVNASSSDLLKLGSAVCKKLASCPRPSCDNILIDFTTGVLCDCLKLLKAIIEHGGGAALRKGTAFLLSKLGTPRWSELNSRGVLSIVSSTFQNNDDATLIDLMGAIFDGFLSSCDSASSVSICCDKDSRKLGFEVVASAASACRGHDGYAALVHKINGIMRSATPYLRHRWGQHGTIDSTQSRTFRSTSKYSGLRNQGCTCYMNSFLQQLFMMPDLRKSMCAAPLPASLRTSGGSFAKGADLVGKKISLAWESGVSYDAIVEGFDEETNMHTIRYCRMEVASVGGAGHQTVSPEEIARIPPELPDEFILSEGRPGKETGVFELVDETTPMTDSKTGESTSESPSRKGGSGGIEETEDEALSRHLLEEVQRTFIHLEEGSRGRCFDPRALVEACNCLKLEFDVWQQNDASEFAMKLLDRMEIALKKWAPENFRYLEHTFGLKQTKLKICKECGLKTKREENLMSIDCQIRGKTDVHDALSTMCEVEHMEGNNKVFCDRCKKNTDTVLKTAISALPDMLILSLKRFDLDYTTFETVKLNSRCEFGQTLNMKRYTLEGMEAIDSAGEGEEGKEDPTPMDTNDDDAVDPLSSLPDDDYEYKLAGVLVHAGVAQGGHYYSFIRDRTPAGASDGDKWYRFDDEDVTVFDPSSIEAECFGGKVKRETKIHTGQVHAVESEQFANALMLFYEKVKRADQPMKVSTDEEHASSAKESQLSKTSGYDAFEPDVRRSNATHRWQTFLFDAEFHNFLLELLKRSGRSSGPSTDRMETSPVQDVSWRGPVLQLLFSFFLDVLLYSAQKPSLDEWTDRLSNIMTLDRECAKMFVHDLAARTATVSSNWLRTYTSDCPDRRSRIAALVIFASAIKTCSTIDTEEALLRRWADACQEQVVSKFGETAPLPTRLEGSWASLEDLKYISEGKGSAIGKIISYVTTLLEAAPRTWRYNSELCVLIRDLAHVDGILRSALKEALVPPRLLALLLRGRATPEMRMKFPGAALSLEAADTQIRMESSPTTHMMPLGTSQIAGGVDIAQRSVSGGHPSPVDYFYLFEAFACLAGMPGSIHAPLIREFEDTERNQTMYQLTDKADAAFRTIFEEACANPEEGMSKQEMDRHLSRSEAILNVPRYKLDFFKKNPRLELGLFISFYRDLARNDEGRVRAELHACGFRPDLTRRSSQSIGNAEQYWPVPESVAIDMGIVCDKQGLPDLGPMVEDALKRFDFFSFAYTGATETIADNLLAYMAYKRDTTELIEDALSCLYHAPATWNVNADSHVVPKALAILASVPDERQTQRISAIMLSSAQAGRQSQIPVGLLRAANVLYELQLRDRRYSQQYQYSAYGRYLGVIRSLIVVRAVENWMMDAVNREHWKPFEHDLRDEDPARSHHHQVRNDMTRREVVNPAVPYETSTGDSMQDESEDDDSRDLDPLDNRKAVYLVEGAGLEVLNGKYEQMVDFEDAYQFQKEVTIEGRKEVARLFRCSVNNNTKHWFISIVPDKIQPGTNKDRDFYSAPAPNASRYPPTDGWVKQLEGREPAPRVSRVEQDADGDRPMWDDGVDGGPQQYHI